MAVKTITEPANEPITLADVKTRLSISDDRDDDNITAYIAAAREEAEHYLRRRIISQTVEMVLDVFTYNIELESGPVQSITSVKYVDENGTEQTLDSADYSLDNYGLVDWLLPAYGEDWPNTQAVANAVKIRYVSGWGDDPADVPGKIKQAIIILVGHWLRFQKEAESGIGPSRIPKQFYDLLSGYRRVLI